MDMQEWGRLRLEKLGLPSKPNALDATFLAAAKLAGQGLTPYLGEEANTGAFLGALFATFPWAVGVFGAPGLLPLSFAGYRKGGHQKDSESVTGADFALAVHLPQKRVRIAVFQAKRVKPMIVTSEQLSKTSPFLAMPTGQSRASFPSIDLHHLIGADNDKWQYTQLIDHGFATLSLAMATGEKPNANDRALAWIHYLAYDIGDPWCVSLAELGNFTRWYARNKHTALTYPKGSVAEERLRKVLLQGSRPAGVRTKGWLTLGEAAARDALPEFLGVGPVYITDAIAGGPVPDFFPGIKPFVKTRARPSAGPTSKPTSKPTSAPGQHAASATGAGKTPTRRIR